jgi:hypothetical protein
VKIYYWSDRYKNVSTRTSAMSKEKIQQISPAFRALPPADSFRGSQSYRFAFGQKIWHSLFFSPKANFKIFPKLRRPRRVAARLAEAGSTGFLLRQTLPAGSAKLLTLLDVLLVLLHFVRHTNYLHSAAWTRRV